MSAKKIIKKIRAKTHDHEIHKDNHKEIPQEKHHDNFRHDDAQLNQSSGLTTERIEALSDGVFSIAMTLLVLAFVIPANLSQTGLKQALIHLAPQFVTYFLSFVVLGTFWVGHHNQFYWINHSDRTFLWINIFFLMFISLIPFSTSLLGMYANQQVAVLIYGVNLISCGALLNFQWSYATRGHRLVSANLSHHIVQLIERRIIAAGLFYIVAILLSFYSVNLSIAVFILAQVLLIKPTISDKMMI